MTPALANRVLPLVTAGFISFVSLGSTSPALAGATSRTNRATTTFADEFEGPAGRAVDPARWQTETGNSANNHERQYYTPGNANAALDGVGHLAITARKENPGGYQCWYGPCQYTSARLNTAGRFSQAYGHFEARMRMPRGQGMWPALWMLGTDYGTVGWPASGEIDIVENVGFEPGTVHSTVHGPGYSGANAVGTSYTLSGGRAFADAFHTFALDWSPHRMSWSVDGRVYNRRTPADLEGKPWVFEKPFFLVLDLAVGGYWPGDPDASTVFPQQLLVDYVRVSTGDSAGTVQALHDARGRHHVNGSSGRWRTVGSGGVVWALGRYSRLTTPRTTHRSRARLRTCPDTRTQKWTTPPARDTFDPRRNRCRRDEVPPLGRDV